MDLFREENLLPSYAIKTCFDRHAFSARANTRANFLYSSKSSDHSYMVVLKNILKIGQISLGVELEK